VLSIKICLVSFCVVSLLASCGGLPCPEDTEDIGIGYCIVKPSPTPSPSPTPTSTPTPSPR
jgi:hypothetical protein